MLSLLKAIIRCSKKRKKKKKKKKNPSYPKNPCICCGVDKRVDPTNEF